MQHAATTPSTEYPSAARPGKAVQSWRKRRASWLTAPLRAIQALVCTVLERCVHWSIPRCAIRHELCPTPSPKPSNPKPQTPNPKLQTPNLQPLGVHCSLSRALSRSLKLTGIGYLASRCYVRDCRRRQSKRPDLGWLPCSAAWCQSVGARLPKTRRLAFLCLAAVPAPARAFRVSRCVCAHSRAFCKTCINICAASPLCPPALAHVRAPYILYPKP